MWQPATRDATDMPLDFDARRLALRQIGQIGGLGASLLVSGCSSIRWRDAGSDSAAESHPPFYRLTAPTPFAGTGWLLSSIHAGQRDLFPLPRTITDRFASADELALELNIPQREAELKAAFSERAFLPAGQTLDQYIEPSAIDWLRRRFDISEGRWQALARLAPWAITRALHGTDRPSQTQVSLGLETRFLELAAQQNKPVRELEMAIDQIRALAGGSIRWQAELLNQRVTDPQFWDNKVNRLIRAWRQGDQAALLTIKVDAFGSDPLRAPLRQRMFTNRDRKMALRLTELMRKPRSVFAVVGAFHLVGRSNLLTQLNALGVTTDRIAYPARRISGKKIFTEQLIRRS